MPSTSSKVRLKPAPALSKAEWTIHVAGTIYLDDTQASMLLMVRTKATVVWATVLDVSGVGKRYCARLIETRRRYIRLGITIDESFKHTVFRAALTQIDFVVTQDNMCINHTTTLGTNATRQFKKDIIHILDLSRH
jgi:hypothetical protein